MSSGRMDVTGAEVVPEGLKISEGGSATIPWTEIRQIRIQTHPVLKWAGIAAGLDAVLFGVLGASWVHENGGDARRIPVAVLVGAGFGALVLTFAF